MQTVAYAVVLSLLLSTAARASPASSSTLTNLRAAFEAELAAAERFSAFGRKAEQEGLPRVGRLFRAIARGEEIHARNHAEVLRSLAAQPSAAATIVEVKSTLENLRAAVEEEKLDRDERYPGWLAGARESGDPTPLATFGVAMFVERAHVLLLEQALRSVESGLDAPVLAGELCVSRRSGYVTTCTYSSALACGPSAQFALEYVN